MIGTRATMRARVVGWVMLAQILLLCLLCGLFIWQARDTIRAEQDAAQRAARDVVVASLGALLAEGDRDLMKRLSDRLAPMPHVRIRFFDAMAGEYPAKVDPEHAVPPPWVARLLTPTTKQMRIPLADRGRTLGIVWIEGAPAPEIARVWHQFTWLAGLSALAALAMSALLYGVIGQAMSPLSVLRRALRELEHGDLATRVPVPSAPDLAPIADQVNRLAGSLEAAEHARRDLSRQLTELQEAERKHIAMELHDEMGPCLFGLAAGTDQLAGQVPPELRPQVSTLQSIVEQMRQLNRRVLAALRPMTVGQLPLEDVLRDLVATQAAHTPGIRLALNIDPLPATTEAQDLTLYRVVQEAMTNACRHAGTDRIDINVRCDGGDLLATVRDHGCGVGQARPGTGLRGMEERLRASGGSMTLADAPGGGTLLTARLPLQKPRQNR